MSARASKGSRVEATMSPSSAATESRYHHFIPQFILRNFAHPYQPAKEHTKASKKTRNGRRRADKDGPRPGDPMLNMINLAGETPTLDEAPVAKTLGMQDMYWDLRNDKKPHHLEDKLSRLESHAAMVMHKMRKAFEAGDRDVWITRSERDVLRKFLFIMKYRGSNAYERYHHSDVEGYSSNDKERLLEYMRKKSYKKPVDVWFDNIEAMLALKMDPQMKWTEWLNEHVYPDDAMWFIAHCQMMYLALCTPASPDDEFLLTENAYSIHEGPVSYFVDPVTKEMRQGSDTEFHILAVISPKLMIVLRSFLLPVPEEDADEDMRNWRKSKFEQSAAQHNDPLNAHSILEDLPISKARNTYTKIVDGRLVLLEGEDGFHRADHKFCFRFFPITTEHTDRINSIMLENAHHASTIVFKSQEAACRTLKRYLTMPCEFNGLPCFKMVADSENDEKLKFLKNLKKVVSDLGSPVTLTYEIGRGKFSDPLVMVGQALRARMLNQTEPTDFMQLYAKLGSSHIISEESDFLMTVPLGGSLVTFPKDMDQASKMLNMRIKIDVWSKGLSNSIREDIREKLGELFCQLPVRRVWLYLKRVRFMLRSKKGEKADQAIDAAQLASCITGNETEDVIVDASDCIRTGRLGHLMWFAAINELLRPKIVGPAGSICECGIPAIEEKARLCRYTARFTELDRYYRTSFCTHEKTLEVVTRCIVRQDFDEIFGASEAAPNMQALERVLFDIIYPCPRGQT